MTDQPDPLEQVKRRLLRRKTVVWCVVGVGLLGGAVALLEDIQKLFHWLAPSPPSISVVSLSVDPMECAFTEDASTGMRSFKMPDRIRHTLLDLVVSRQRDEEPRRAYAELNPAIGYLFSRFRAVSDSVPSDNLSRIFELEQKREMLRMLTPTSAKSVRLDNSSLERSQFFDIQAKILTRESMENANGFVRDYVLPFRALLLGRLEPIFNVTVKNNGTVPVLLTTIDLEVRDTRPKAAEFPSGPVPVARVVDVTLPNRPGRWPTQLSEVLQINPESSLVIPVRLTPESRSLRWYELRILVKGPEVEVSTEYFGLEM